MASGGDPQCHLASVPRDRPLGALGEAGVGRARPGGVHERYASRPIVLQLPRQKEVERASNWLPIAHGRIRYPPIRAASKLREDRRIGEGARKGSSVGLKDILGGFEGP